MVGRDKRTLELEKEVDHLKWQLSAMETSRRTYEEATNRLVTFLEQVTSVLQGGGGSQVVFCTPLHINFLKRGCLRMNTIFAGLQPCSEEANGVYSC